MSNPDSIVSVSVTIQDASVTQAGFGTPLIMTHEATWTPELVRSYSSTAAMVLDGFAAAGATVLAATAIFAQNPKVTTIKVGRRTSTPSAMTRVVTVAAVANSTVYTVTINGTPFAFTSDATATDLEIATGLHGLINAGAEPVTSTDNADGTITLVEDVVGVIFGLAVTRTLLTQDDTTALPSAGTINLDYANIKLEDNDFYGVLMVSSATLEIVALAALVESDRKLLLVQSSDSDIQAGTGGNLFATLNTAAYARTAAIWNGDNFDFANAAWMGKMYAKNPGSATWAYKTLGGVSSDILTDSQITAIEAVKGNYYTATKGLNLTQEGWASSGRYLDITRGIDWLTVRLQERIINLLANSDKIPYTQAGITALESEVRGQLDEAVGRGVVNADYVVTVPDINDISSTTKATRALGDIDFSATLTGAIHTVTVVGTVSA